MKSEADLPSGPVVLRKRINAILNASDHGSRVYYACLTTKISKDDPLPPDSELPKVRLVFSRVVGSLENHSNQVGQDDWKLLAKYAGGLDG
jgi:hypothetical protein